MLSTPQNKFESNIALSGVDSKKINGILDFETYFELLNIPIPSRLEIMLERFEEEKLIIKSGKFYNITNLGAILFAKDLNLFEDISRKSIRVIVYEGKDRLKTKKEYSENQGYAVAFDNLLKLIGALLPANEIIKGALRTEVKLYPEIAIRELIANALIHQDFEIRAR